MAGTSEPQRSRSAVPLSIEQLVARAQSFDYNPNIALRHWLRSAATLLKEATIYQREGDDQQTYLLLFRHAQLILRNLPTHPQASLPQSRQALALANKEVQHNLRELEVLKPRITKRHERYSELLRLRDQRQKSLPTGRSMEQEEKDTKRVPKDLNKSLPHEPLNSYDAQTIKAGENKDLAVKLARDEIRRRASERRLTRQVGICPTEEQARRTAGVWHDWDHVITETDRASQNDDLTGHLQRVRQQIDQSTNAQEDMSPKAQIKGEVSYRYPPIIERQDRADWTGKILDIEPNDIDTSSTAHLVPERPPKIGDAPNISTIRPKIPGKEALGHDRDTSFSTSTSPPATKQVSQHPAYTFEASAYLENGTPLRTIFLPPLLRHRFLDIASPNTKANLETCGILCGTLISNALFISKLVIPEQDSTSDTCEMTNESALFDFVDGEDLMVLGWIHTHPTQTCFMSSRDLHTHCGYQVMMAESIAIVCAPSKQQWGVFRLTDPPGMPCVLNCTQKGLFHPHSEESIYTDARRPGHVHEAQGMDFETVDLRVKQ